MDEKLEVLKAENERLRDLFIKSASIMFDIREQMRCHDGIEECPFCMGELFSYNRGSLVRIEKAFMQEVDKS